MNATELPILLPVEDTPVESETGRLVRRIAVLVSALALATLPVVLFRDAVPDAAALTGLAAWPQPYFVPQYGWLLYLAVPAVVLSAWALLLAPGVVLALALGASARVEQWFLASYAISLVVVSAAAGIVQGIAGAPLVEGGFMAVASGCGILSLGVLALAARRRALVWPSRRDALAVIPLLAAPLVLLVALEPKFLWEAFNGDGADALETARLLLRQPLPFWSPIATNLASFPGLTSMTFAFPASWFVRLFGPLEVAARLPFPLALAAVYAGVVELARARRGRTEGRDPGVVMRWLVWAGLVPFALAMAFSASYSPYSADIAMPAAQDALLIALFLGTAAAFVERRAGWVAFLGALTLLSLPNGAMLIVLLLGAALLTWKPRPTRYVVAWGGAFVAASIALELIPHALKALGVTPPGGEYALKALLHYYAYIQFGDVRRLLWLAVPCGIVPALALFAWKKQDDVARSITLVIAAYFLFFYFQGLTALHHFSPVMVLPLVVLWRVAAGLDTAARSRLMLVTGGGALAAIMLSLPQVAPPYTDAREVGSTVMDALGGYSRSDPRAYQRGTIMLNVFPPDWSPTTATQRFGGSAVVWTYYANHPRPGATTNYLIQPATLAPPAGWRRVTQEDGTALDVRSDAVMAAQWALRPATDRGAGIYTIPRWMIFSSIKEPGSGLISTAALLERMGFNVKPLLRKQRPQHGI